MTEDWADALASLLAEGARFIVVGAHAIAVHGVPRATQDLDIWIETTRENAIVPGTHSFVSARHWRISESRPTTSSGPVR